MPYIGTTHLRPPSSPRAYRHALGATEIIRHLGEGSPLLPGTILAPPAYRRAASNFENLFSLNVAPFHLSPPSPPSTPTRRWSIWMGWSTLPPPRAPSFSASLPRPKAARRCVWPVLLLRCARLCARRHRSLRSLNRTFIRMADQCRPFGYRTPSS